MTQFLSQTYRTFRGLGLTANAAYTAAYCAARVAVFGPGDVRPFAELFRGGDAGRLTAARGCLRGCPVRR